MSSHAALALGVACMGSALVLVVAEWRSSPGVRVAAKVAASSAFVGAALLAGALDSRYGRLILLALALSWLGDLLLLSARSALFLAGIGAFFLAHVAFAAAFASTPLTTAWLAGAAAAMTIVAAVTLRWLLPHLEGVFRIAVPAYVAALAAMVTLAFGAAPGLASWLVPAAAVAFAASDISVARDRFVAPGVANRAWGLPLYFAAQVLFALTVRLPPA
jgi:uncharacterized membrane protein YhhN